jgi:hypothetical protein
VPTHSSALQGRYPGPPPTNRRTVSRVTGARLAADDVRMHSRGRFSDRRAEEPNCRLSKEEMTLTHTKICTLLAGAMLVAIPFTAMAREESKIRLFMEKVEGGPGGELLLMEMEEDGSERGQLRTDLSPDRASLHLKVSRLAPNLEHIVLGDGVEIARFTTNAAGNAEVRLDLFETGGDTTPSFDPRGKLVTVNDGTSDVLEAWVYGDPSEDPARPRIKEVTSLAREAATEGSVDARYDALPSGGARFNLAMRGVAPGDYEVLVNGTPVATLTPNPGGSAALDLRIQPGNGGGSANGRRPHKVRGPLEVNPRSQMIELVLGGVVQFAGPMLAQIPGLGVCNASSASADLIPDPAQTMGTGSVSLGVEESCDLHMTLTLDALAAGDYDLVIAGVDVGDLTIADAGAGTGSVVLEFDETPDALAGELPLPAGAVAGASLAIQEKLPLGTDVVMSGMLP